MDNNQKEPIKVKVTNPVSVPDWRIWAIAIASIMFIGKSCSDYDKNMLENQKEQTVLLKEQNKKLEEQNKILKDFLIQGNKNQK
jgi:hypothetical protein